MKIRNGEKGGNSVREIPRDENGKQRIGEYTYFGKHFKILPVVFRNTKIRIASGSDNSTKNQVRNRPNIDKLKNSSIYKLTCNISREVILI